MQLVILAGGKGTRLGLTDIPKPMCPVAGKPLLERQIELAKAYGIDEVFILSGHLASVISDYFGDGSKFGVKIHHVVEPFPLGTAGSLKLLQGRLKDRFMVFYGDVVMDFNLTAFQNFDAEDPLSAGTLLVHPNNHPYDSDLVETDRNGNITGFLAKPHTPDLLYRNLTNAAVYILSPEVLNYIEDAKMQDFGKDIFPRLLRHNVRLRAYQTPEFIRDIGTQDRLAQVYADVDSGKVARRNLRYKQKAVFLDRDGTLNVNMDTHPAVESFTLLPGVAEAVRRLNESDYLSIVVTNQPMIAKGFVTETEVENIHKKMETLLGSEKAYLDKIYYCPHHPDKGFPGEVPELKIACECRKPKPGMLRKAAADFNLDLSQCWMVGDSDCDTQAGRAAGCKCLQIGSEVKDLSEAVNIILGEKE